MKIIRSRIIVCLSILDLYDRIDILFDHESASTRPTTDGRERATATIKVAESGPVQLKMSFEIENAGSLKDWRSADSLEPRNDL